MSDHRTQKFHVSSGALAGLAHEGIGWGHDLATGDFRGHALPKRPGPVVRLYKALKGVQSNG